MQYFYDFAVVDKSSILNVSDLGIAMTGGYILLVVGLPLLLALALLIIIAVLFSISSKLGDVNDQLRELNENVLRGPISEQEITARTLEREKAVASDVKSRNLIAAIALGIVIGLATIIVGLITEGVSQIILFAAGASIVVLTILLPIIEELIRKAKSR